MSDQPQGDGGRLRRLFKGGLPTIAGSGVVALVPLSGSFFLSNNDYAIWALASTLSTIFIIFDFGTASLSTKLAAEGRLNRATLLKLLAITGIPPIFLGAVVIAIWPWYAGSANLIGATETSVFLMLACVATGTVLRSFGVIYSAIALGREHYNKRAQILLSGALIQLVVTLTALFGGAGVLSLGLGIIGGGLAQMAAGAALEHKFDETTVLDLDLAGLIRRFVRSRGTATLLGLMATQLDRWALGLAATPSLLSTYDLATRFATIPKIALLAFAAGLVAEAARTPDLTKAIELARTSRKAITGLFALGSIVTSVVAMIVLAPRVSLLEAGLVVLLVTIGHGANASTIPGGLILTGWGRPDLELRYLWPLAALCAAAYVAGILVDSGQLLILGWFVAMTSCSIYFALMVPKYLKKAAKLV